MSTWRRGFITPKLNISFSNEILNDSYKEAQTHNAYSTEYSISWWKTQIWSLLSDDKHSTCHWSIKQKNKKQKTRHIWWTICCKKVVQHTTNQKLFHMGMMGMWKSEYKHYVRYIKLNLKTQIKLYNNLQLMAILDKFSYNKWKETWIFLIYSIWNRNTIFMNYTSLWNSSEPQLVCESINILQMLPWKFYMKRERY